VSCKEVLVVLLGEFEGLYNALLCGERIDREWHRRLNTLGKKISVRCGDKIEEGVAEEVDGDGNLILRRSDGSVMIIAAGDVTLRAHNY